MKCRKLDFPVLVFSVIMLLFSGCAGNQRITIPVSERKSPVQAISWHGVLVAGAYTDEDLKIDNWDYAIEGMLAVLLDAGLLKSNIRIHSSKPQNIGQSRQGITLEPAWKNRIAGSIKNFDLQNGNGLILYFSGHGFDNQGFYLESEEDFRNVFSPGDLDAILDSLGDIPVVIFISACFSGDFLTGEGSIVDENRLILTASSADRNSFGCGAGSLIPEWDDSLLRVLRDVDREERWEDVIARIDEDVARKETEFVENRKSLPQHYLPNPLHPGFGDLLQRLSRNMN